MAESVPIYVEELLRRQLVVAPQMGVDILASGRTPYAVNLLQLTILGTLMKLLVDKGVITDAELVTALDHALDGVWPQWLLEQTPPPPPGEPAAAAPPLLNLNINLGRLL